MNISVLVQIPSSIPPSLLDRLFSFFPGIVRVSAAAAESPDAARLLTLRDEAHAIVLRDALDGLPVGEDRLCARLYCPEAAASQEAPDDVADRQLKWDVAAPV